MMDGHRARLSLCVELVPTDTEVEIKGGRVAKCTPLDVMNHIHVNPKFEFNHRTVIWSLGVLLREVRSNRFLFPNVGRTVRFSHATVDSHRLEAFCSRDKQHLRRADNSETPARVQATVPSIRAAVHA
jgi:hypothetical protein